MTDFMKLIRVMFRSTPRSELTAARQVLDRDPDLRKIRKDHRQLEVRVSALEVQARVRARRKH